MTGTSLAPTVLDAIQTLTDFAAGNADVDQVLRRQYELGLAWPHFRVGEGGLGLSRAEARAVRARLTEIDLPRTPASFVGLHQASALFHDFGSDRQRALIPRIFTGEDQWCQLFSEPGAGSDLANVGCRAELRGGTWHIDGQKVWTSNARHASHALLLARTDPGEVKHRGMTMFVLDMRQPGVEVRPLRQMDGGARFSEVFLVDARVSDTDRVGDVGAGWAMAMHILTTERDGASELFDRPVEEILELWRTSSPRPAPALRDEVVRLWVSSRVNQLSGARARRSGDPAEKARLGGIAKIAASEHAQRHADLLAVLLGPSAVAAADYEAAFEDDLDPRSTAAKDFGSLSPHRFILRCRAMSIEGGTNEIARNVAGERVLGLPPEPRADKGRPWRDLLKS
ncbi:acyl-CoA dehydrogenase family protein [Sporichthya brevicatena]|uniref:Acyl-CoA dehydrogenase family protein n=1 Tax=Sporichthya brevicatena TaxID=171442 RepID=A0ABN1H4G4_9ACTN